MYEMFKYATNFNQNISMWNVGNATTWTYPGIINPPNSTHYSLFSHGSALTIANSPF